MLSKDCITPYTNLPGSLSCISHQRHHGLVFIVCLGHLLLTLTAHHDSEYTRLHQNCLPVLAQPQGEIRKDSPGICHDQVIAVKALNVA